MIVLIIQIVAGIAAYYFMKKKLAERYTTDFIKSVKWILISPIVQIVIFVPACISALQITKTVDDVTKLRFPGSSEYLLGVISNSLSNDNLSYGGITSMASGSTYSDVELSASITMLVGAVAAVLFIIMTVWQFRGIFGQGQEATSRLGTKCHT